MKKLLALLMAVSAVFFFSCSNESGGNGSSGDNESSSSGTTSKGQTYTSNSYTGTITEVEISKGTAYKNQESKNTFSTTFDLNFPADNDTYFYKCYSALKDNTTVTYKDIDEITIPNPKAYYLEYKKSDNTLNAVYVCTCWLGDSYTDNGETKYCIQDFEKTAGDQIPSEDTDKLIASYSSDKISIAYLSNETSFDWEGKSTVYLNHSADCTETYTVSEDKNSLISEISEYFVIFNLENCDKLEDTGTVKLKLNNTKDLTLTM